MKLKELINRCVKDLHVHENPYIKVYNGLSQDELLLYKNMREEDKYPSEYANAKVIASIYTRGMLIVHLCKKEN